MLGFFVSAKFIAKAQAAIEAQQHRASQAKPTTLQGRQAGLYSGQSGRV